MVNGQLPTGKPKDWVLLRIPLTIGN